MPRQSSWRRRRGRGQWPFRFLGLAVVVLGLLPTSHAGGSVAQAAGVSGQAEQGLPELPPLERWLKTSTPGELPSPFAELLPQPVEDALPQPVKDLVAGLTPAIAPQPPQAPSAPAEPPPFWGFGSWVDLYDYGHPGSLSPEAILDDMGARGVRTAYVQTARWNSPADIVNPAALGAFVERAHERGMKVVGWYMPGFADLDLDIRRSLAVLQYTSPKGQRVDGFAPDIEDRAAVGGSRDRFNHGIIAYSQRLRAAVAAGTVLAAIVPDARNNERAPSHWAGFPWPEIARDYDVVMPMAYWSVVKPQRRCLTVQSDAGTYTRYVMDRTLQLMGRERPIHIIGGIADCVTPQEVSAYAAALAEKGAVGGGIYDFLTSTASGAREPIWSAQSGLRNPGAS